MDVKIHINDREFSASILDKERTSDGNILAQVKIIDPRSDLISYEKSCIERVIFNFPATIVIWSDGTKTVVKCQIGDNYTRETGLAMCIAKKYLGNKGNFNEVFKKFIEDYDPRKK